MVNVLDKEHLQFKKKVSLIADPNVDPSSKNDSHFKPVILFSLLCQNVV